MTLPSNATCLDNGETFPTLNANLVSGGTLTLPDALEGSWGVVLFYRGHWCPFCRGQLTDFQKHLEEYQAQNVKVFALSVDAEEDAAQTVTRHSLSFPVAYGLNAAEVAEKVGAYTTERGDGKPTYVQATGFVLTPEGKVALALYSSGAVGRLNAADTLGFVKYAQQQ